MRASIYRLRLWPKLARNIAGFAFWRTLTLTLVCLCAWTSAHAFDPVDVVRQQIPEARVAGSGTLRWFGLHIYDARLYVGPSGFSSADMTARPFALDINYARAFSGVRIAEKGRDVMESMGTASKAQAQAWCDTLTHIYPDVQAGDHLTGLFVPGQGTTFYFNGRIIGQIPGDDFARAFFSIWLDPHTEAPDLRAALLAGSKD